MKKSLTELHTETFTAEREWTVDGIPVLSACVCVPQPVPAMDRVSRRIWRYYQLQCRSFLATAKGGSCPRRQRSTVRRWKPARLLPQFQATLNYRVTYNEGGLWSLYTQSREVTLPGRTLMQRWGDTWDLRTGYPVSMGEFFPRRWRLEVAADGPGSSRDHPAGGGRHRPVPGKLEAAFAPAVQCPQFLPDRRGSHLLLSHVRHCAGGGGDPLFYGTFR